MTKEQYVESEAEARGKRSQIALDVLRAKFADEEKRHASDTGRDRDQVRAAKLLFVKKRLKDEHIDGRGVLQEDGVGGGRQFCRDDEEQQQARVEHGSQHRHLVQTKPFAAREEGDREGREQGAPPR